MFYSLQGILKIAKPSLAVVDCHGVGYKCFISDTTLSSLPPVGGEVFLFTYLAVREDAMDLYGFFREEELDFFKLLISVSGIGPKAAMAILSAFTPEQLAVSIAAGDAKAITKAQGVGAKTAQRLVLELKEKLGCEAVIHMDPIEVDNELVKTVRKQVEEQLKNVEETLTIHDFRMVTGPTHTNLIFDIVKPFSCTESDDELKNRIMKAILERTKNVNCVITVDTPFL